MRWQRLNPVPIRLIHDRWIGKFAEFRAGAITALKAHVERGARRMKPDHVYTAYIATDLGFRLVSRTTGEQLEFRFGDLPPVEQPSRSGLPSPLTS